jgi:hypothetical protein
MAVWGRHGGAGPEAGGGDACGCCGGGVDSDAIGRAGIWRRKKIMQRDDDSRLALRRRRVAAAACFVPAP